MPSGTEFLDKCVDENGQMTTGLTIEGELNKVRTLTRLFGLEMHAWDAQENVEQSIFRV